MKFRNIWSVASKDLESIRGRRSIVYGIIFLPLLLAVTFSVFVGNEAEQSIQSGVPLTQMGLGLDSIIYFFVILAAILPGSIAAYSIVGEKVERSLEPLLATPMSDREILLGKSIAAFLPPILATWAGATIFMAASDYITTTKLSFYYFPDWISGVMLFVVAPLAAIFSVELTVIVSSRVSDVRGATQIASLMFIPFMGVFFAEVNGDITFSVGNLLVFSAILLIIDLVLFSVSTSTFRREEILTRWK